MIKAKINRPRLSRLNINSYFGTKKILLIPLFSLSATIAIAQNTFPSNGKVGIGTTTPSSKLDITTNALGVSQTDTSGISLVNTTAAVAGAQQISPALRWRAQGWKTNATAASQTVDFRSYVIPTQGGANPTGDLVFQSQINGAAYTPLLAVGSNGWITFGNPVLTTLSIAPTSTALNDRGFIFRSSTVALQGAAFHFASGQGVRNPTSGDTYNIRSTETFNPTSGMAPYANIYVEPTINQTGGASGITRGIYVDPTLTAAADFRAIETSNNSGFGIYQRGASARSYFAGNVGIGTTLPSSKLDIFTGTTGTALNITGLAIGGRNDAGFGFSAINGNVVRYANIGLQISTALASEETGGLTFSTINHGTLSEKMFIQADGNVGIGTFTPGHKLAVNGTIHAKEVKVDLNGWSDYVFKDDYDLLPLADLKSYIQKNRHLPEIASEKEVEKNGIDLGETNKLLLKKIEELTLYLLQQEERIKKLETLVKRQK